MKISSLGFSKKTSKPSISPIPINDFLKPLVEGLKKNIEGIGKITPPKTGFRALIQSNAPRQDDPYESGWTFLINEKDSAIGQEIIDVIQPLATYRKMDDVNSPLVFNNTPENFWVEWISKYALLKKGRQMQPPKYILIIGSPNEIPFEFQSMLSDVAFVGRLDFDDIKELETYTEKVKRMEKGNLVEKEVTFFATDHEINASGCYDPTHYNQSDIDTHLVPEINGLNFKPNKLLKNNATKKDLLDNLQKSKPCSVYASCWGVNASGETLDVQKQLTGSLCCQGDYSKGFDPNLVLTSQEIPDTPFLEGGLFFQQSSFSYGSPAISSLSHWVSDGENLGIPKQLAPTDFVAPLPKRLVYHKHGPLAFVGHLDELLAYGYAQEETPGAERRERIEPTRAALNDILKGRPIGYALNQMTMRRSVLNTQISNNINKVITAFLKASTDAARLKVALPMSNLFLMRNEVKNYMIFGDPAVRL